MMKTNNLWRFATILFLSLMTIPVCGETVEEMPKFPGGDQALMEFIENNGSDAWQATIADEHARQNAFRDEENACLLRCNSFVACLIANNIADFRIHFGGNSFRKHSRGETAWLQDENALILRHGLQQKFRNLRGFTRTRRSGDDDLPFGG